MDTETITSVAQLASSLTTNAVLMLWLYREIKRADRAQSRLEMIHDKLRDRADFESAVKQNVKGMSETAQAKTP